MKNIKKLVEQEIEEQERISPEETRTEFVRGRLHGLRRVLYLIGEEERKDNDPAFDAFYAAYPRKVGKPNAKKAWKKIKPNAELVEKIMAALEVHKRTRQWQNKEYIPHPATWLNQERWNDEVETTSSAPADSKYEGI